MSFISKDLDLEKSLKLNPPIYPEGVIFKKRIRVKRERKEKKNKKGRRKGYGQGKWNEKGNGKRNGKEKE